MAIVKITDSKYTHAEMEDDLRDFIILLTPIISILKEYGDDKYMMISVFSSKIQDDNFLDEELLDKLLTKYEYLYDESYVPSAGIETDIKAILQSIKPIVDVFANAKSKLHALPKFVGLLMRPKKLMDTLNPDFLISMLQKYAYLVPTQNT